MRSHVLMVVFLFVALTSNPPAWTSEPTGNPVRDKRIAEQREVQTRLAEEWAKRDNLKTIEEKITLAVRCMCTSASVGSSIYDTETGTKLTADAKAFLVQNRRAALPLLLRFIEHGSAFERSESKFLVEFFTSLFGDQSDPDETFAFSEIYELSYHLFSDPFSSKVWKDH